MAKETGFYDYGWRQYQSDLGRWFGMDQLSEVYSSFSPYAYVGNNPVIRTDHDGRKWAGNDMQMLEAEHRAWRNSGGGGGFASYFAGGGSGFASEMNSYFGTGNAKMNFYQAMAAPSFTSNTIRWWSGSVTQKDYRIGDEIYTDADFGMLHSLTYSTENITGISALQDFTKNWYSNAGRVNWFIGAAGTGIDAFVNRFYIGTARPNAPVNFLGTKFYGNGRTFLKGSHVAGVIGRFSFGLAVFLDYNAYKQGEISGEKFTFNTAMGAYGLTPMGAIPAMLYFGVDAFYPGGWTGDAKHPGAIKDTERRQAEFDSIINANSGIPRQYIFPYGLQKF